MCVSVCMCRGIERERIDKPPEVRVCPRRQWYTLEIVCICETAISTNLPQVGKLCGIAGNSKLGMCVRACNGGARSDSTRNELSTDNASGMENTKLKCLAALFSKPLPLSVASGGPRLIDHSLGNWNKYSLLYSVVF